MVRKMLLLVALALVATATTADNTAEIAKLSERLAEMDAKLDKLVKILDGEGMDQKGAEEGAEEGGDDGAPVDDKDVVKLTGENYAAELAAGETLVKFFAPWCGHCSAMKGDYAKVRAGAACCCEGCG